MLSNDVGGWRSINVGIADNNHTLRERLDAAWSGVSVKALRAKYKTKPSSLVQEVLEIFEAEVMGRYGMGETRARKLLADIVNEMATGIGLSGPQQAALLRGAENEIDFSALE